MEIIINIQEYSNKTGIRLEWEDNFEIQSAIEKSSIVIRANKEGLISLSRHLLTLSQSSVPIGRHIHFDDLNSLEEGSIEIIFEKI